MDFGHARGCVRPFHRNRAAGNRPGAGSIASPFRMSSSSRARKRARTSACAAHQVPRAIPSSHEAMLDALLRRCAHCSALTAADTPDPRNPTCPAEPDWGDIIAHDADPARCGWAARAAGRRRHRQHRCPSACAPRSKAMRRIEEIWLRSRGGNAQAGNAAGKIIRSYPGMVTRIPAGWTCFSSCNFVFMGGDRRFVDPGGIFMVHMFTYTRSARCDFDSAVKEGSEGTTPVDRRDRATKRNVGERGQ